MRLIILVFLLFVACARLSLSQGNSFFTEQDTPHFLDTGLSVSDLGRIAFADLDGDGDQDAVGGDRSGQFTYFENVGTVSIPRFLRRSGTENPLGSFQLESATSPALVDLDDDGDWDLVTGEFYGEFIYFENTGTADSPAFALQSSGPFDGIAIGNDPVPTFVDIDGDTDMDLVAGGTFGAVFIENIGDPTNPAFRLRFGEESPFNGVNGASVIGHPAWGDLDVDGDQDLVAGAFDGLFYYFENTGSSVDPAFVWRTGANNPLNGQDIGNASAPLLTDLDGDGDLDVISGSLSGRFSYLENVGGSPIPNFILQEGQNNPFDNPYDVGTESAPALADLDGDGDLDVVTGSRDAYDMAFLYFENTGTASTPAFLHRSGTENPFEQIEIGASSGSSSSPYLADLDADGDLDLLAGDFFGMFYYYENVGSANNAVFEERVGNDNPLDRVDIGQPGGTGDYSRPVLLDLDADGDLDLVSGSFAGSFLFFENVGSAANPMFSERTGVSNPFDGLTVYGGSAPALADLDGDGDFDMVSGVGRLNTPEPGVFTYFENVGSVSEPSFEERSGTDNPFEGIDVGSDSTPALADLDGDGDIDLISGSRHGAYHVYWNRGLIGVEPGVPPGELTLTVHPNPSRDEAIVTLELSEPGPTTIAIYDIVGRLVTILYEADLPPGKHIFTWDSGPDASGTYVVRVITSQGIRAKLLAVAR